MTGELAENFILLFAAFYVGFLTGIAFISFMLGRMK